MVDLAVGARQQLARLDVAMQARPLAQQPAAQGGVVSDELDELIEAAQQLGDDRVDVQQIRVPSRPKERDREPGPTRGVAKLGHAGNRSSPHASADKPAAPSLPWPSAVCLPPRPSGLRPAARILAAPSRARSTKADDGH